MPIIIMGMLGDCKGFVGRRTNIAPPRAKAEFLSNDGMENSPDTEKRLTELEIKASFADDLLDQLNQTILLQQQQIDKLVRQIAELRQQAPADADADAAPGVRNLRDELPPHY
jgi:SlyX protein